GRPGTLSQTQGRPGDSGNHGADLQHSGCIGARQGSGGGRLPHEAPGGAQTRGDGARTDRCAGRHFIRRDDMSGERNEAGGVPVWGSDLPRVSTGSAPADRILGGGFPVNSINMIMGEPGTGKTLFAQQLVFHNAGGDRPILYLTTLSEPLAKVVKYLQGFEFFDESKLEGAVVYDEVGDELAEEGIHALVPKVRERIKALSPKIIVIDSFKALHDIAPSIAEMRRVVHDLAGLLTAYETTTFLVGEYSEEQMAVLPEFVVADGIVELLRHESGMRDDRFFRVRKLRGSGYREGRHALRLTSGGVKIYRRLVTPRIAPDYSVVRERVSSGVTGLDAMIGGGIWRGTTTLLGGPTGSGKTTIGLQFVLDGVRQGEPGLYVHLE